MKKPFLLSLVASAVLLAPALPSAAQTPQPFVKKHLYSETADPNVDIAAAIKQATREHKRILLDFGGDWCGDCQVLDIYFHQSPNDKLLADHFVVVHVYIGHMDHNIATAQKYEVPVQRGVPAFAVLDAHGRLLYSQKNKEGETMSRQDAAAVTEFLNQWKG